MHMGVTWQCTCSVSLNHTHLKNKFGHSLPSTPRRVGLSKERLVAVTDNVIRRPAGTAPSIQPLETEGPEGASNEETQVTLKNE